MKKIVTTMILAGAMSAGAWAGGLLHNTNQHIAFLRMMARGASHEIDAVYTNPAGLAFMDHEGWTLSLNLQGVAQSRDVLTTFPMFTQDGHTRLYEGKVFVPVVPSLYGAYKHGKWTFSSFFGFVGGGGKCSFDNGLPLFEASVMAGVAAQSRQLLQGAAGKFAPLLEQNPAALAQYPQTAALLQQGYIDPTYYNTDMALKGRQYIYGLQFGTSYKVLDWLSVFGGIRMNYFSSNYKGHIITSGNEKLAAAVNEMMPLVKTQAPEYESTIMGIAGEGGLANVKIDCKQTGWGVTPVVGADVVWNGLTLAAKYEFKTRLDIENDNKTFESDVPDAFKEKMNDYRHGVNTPNDLPAVLYTAVGYEFIPNKLRATIEYHYYDDKHAGMAHDKQQALRHGTHEVLAGVEWDINKTFTVSCGAQNTDYGLSDDYQSHTSFSCDSYSIGLGGAVNLSKKIKLNAGYFWTNYKDYHRDEADYFGTTLPGKDTYSRTNKVFGVGIDYKF